MFARARSAVTAMFVSCLQLRNDIWNALRSHEWGRSVSWTLNDYFLLMG